MRSNTRCLIYDETGATLIEYALVAFLIALTCIVVITATGANLSALYTSICNVVKTATSGSSSCS